MYIYPFKIFALSKNKRLLNIDQPDRTVGIYDVNKYNFNLANEFATENDLKVSVLLGNLTDNVKLICLDLDDCFNQDGTIEEDTKRFLQEFNSDEYEVSSSGEGIHIYILTTLDLETFIVKDMEGCKSFECYTNKRHIVTTTFDFYESNLMIDKHNEFLLALYNKAMEKRKSTLVKDVETVFQGKSINNDIDIRAEMYNRTPITDMFKLRGLGYKDPVIIEVIDACPDAVDQSAHDAKLIRKLMYYCLDFDTAWEMAKKTNYYKAKDKFHKDKFDNPVYRERTRKFLCR